VSVWDFTERRWESLRTHQAHQAWVRGMSVSPDGRYLAVANAAGLYVRDLTAEQPLPTMENAALPTGGVAFTPDGKRLATTHFLTRSDLAKRFGLSVNESILDHLNSPVVTIRELPSGKILQCSDGWPKDTKRLAFSPDSTIVAGVGGGLLRVIDVDANREIAMIKIRTKHHFQGLSFTPDGRRLMTVSNDASVRCWEVRSWREHAVYSWKIGPLYSIAVAPDGLRAAAGSDRGKIVIWDLED
jgi:WD40 repeat protein